ncbi:calcium-binding protein [Planktotalea sp.]|uniref:calcium-binding protein n=1 Tax=Planktotalea sp. TaxID=2029877 RepID=UPI003D6A4F4F
MPVTANSTASNFLGTEHNDTITDGFEGSDGTVYSSDTDQTLEVNGREGDDAIGTGRGNDLAAGDMVGAEWQYVDGKWVYTHSAVVVSNYGLDTSYNDLIQTGRGDDVLLGNGGDDSLYAGSGEDIINAGRGDDIAFGDNGDDILNLEAGNDYAEGGNGADIVNGGNGNDVIWGDLQSENMLATAEPNASTFSQLSHSSAWTMTDSNGSSSISQSAETVEGETYTISFDLAANLAGGHSSGRVEVVWNGEVVNTVEVTSGAYETFAIDVVSDGNQGELSFNALAPEDSISYNFDGPIINYDKEIIIGGEEVSVKGFAAGQAKLYQVIDGQLNVFDVEAKSYVAVGDMPNFRINSVGFNIEDNLIYGVAKSSGTDSLGNAVNSSDIVMIDAAGATYRIGEGFYADYVGDFDDSGNLWTFHSALNRISVVDVDQFDADGNPVIEHYSFPANMFTDRTFDLAFNTQDGNFYAVISPSANGQAGKVIKIDLSGVQNGGMPTFSEISITGTLYGDEMSNGMAKGAFGAVFMDGESNLYYGLNRGDHDLDSSTGVQGAIFKVNMDWETGQAYSEFMSEAPSTGSNDGAVDPRSSDPFTEIDADAAVLLREPSLTLVDGGNDTLRGGAGEDEIHGNDGDDKLNGGRDDDILFGDQGNDNVSGDAGNDWISGGNGEDKLMGKSGNDEISGDNGADYLNGGADNDTLNGGNGIDKVVGGSGSDEINGGAGNDHLWGGNWTADAASDTFIFNSGTGKDYVHDFEADLDLIDLTSFATDMNAVQDAMVDLGWATVVDLQLLDGGQSGDKIVLHSVDAQDITADVFIF